MEMDSKVILSIIGSLFATYFWFYNNTKTNLQQNLYRKNKINILSTHNFEKTYKTNLQGLISWLDNLYNNSTLIQNYSRHVTIALLYSFMVFVVFWVLGAEGKVSSIKILNNLSLYGKIQVLSSVILYIGIIYLIHNKVYILKTTFSKFILLIILAIPLELVFLDLGTYLGINFSGTSTFILILVIGKDIIKQYLFKVNFGISLIVFGLLLLLFMPHSEYSSYLINKEIYTIGLFLVLLPLTNSLLDYLSLQVSKYMAEKIMEDNSILTILLHLLADVIIAIILLVWLALFLHFSVEGLNMFIDEAIPMKEMLMATWNDPFSVKNGWITFMLLSTLVPTIVHLVLALGALFIAIMPSKQSLKELKMYNKGQEALLESAAHYFTRIAFMQTFFSFVVLILLSLPFWYDKL